MCGTVSYGVSKMTFTETMDYINGFQKGGKPVKDLSRIAALLEELGNPQEQLKVIHIAGTNGKGSVTTYVAAAATKAGFKTGTLTSPYIQVYNDRIRIDGANIPNDVLCRLCEIVKNASVSADCSQFEITFAIALLWFVEEHCDLVILETGIGGLLDATNIIKRPLVSAITSISFDHMAILGDTLPQIAAQKAGIIKAGCPVVLSADNNVEVTEVVRREADIKHAPLTIPSLMDCTILSETLTETQFRYHCSVYTLKMPGRHQVQNALTAIEVIRFLGMHGYLITAAITQQAFSEVQVPARTQILSKDPLILLDGGHNQAGVMALTQLLQQSGQRKVYAICGMMKSKDYVSNCKVLESYCDAVYCVDDFTIGSVSAEELKTYFRRVPETKCLTLQEACQTALKQAKANQGMVLICGSLYLSSAILNHMDYLK